MPMNNNPRYGSNGQSASYGRNQTTYTPKALPLPENYIEKAEEVMRKYANSITSSKLRNILAMISSIYNVERIAKQTLSPTSYNALRRLQIHLIYEYGRNDKKFKEFIQEAHILDYLLDIGKDHAKFMAYAQYMEAIVAYHRFYGGKA